MNGWWRRRSLRARLTLIATAALSVGIAGGSVLLLRGFAISRLHAIDTASRTVASNLTNLAQAGALPQVLPVDPGESAQVTAVNGGVIAASPGTLRTLPLVTPEQLRALARSGPASTATASINGQTLARVRVQAAQVGGSIDYVVIAASLADERATLAGLSHAVLIGAPLLLLLVAVTIWLLLGRALRTVDDLRLGAQAIVDPLNTRRLPVPEGDDEIHHLATTLNDMLDRLARASERERAFIADAAHELRSPVASIQTQLEMAVTTAHPAPTHEFTAGALHDANRLSTLVQDLLALARLESTSSLPSEPVDLAALAGIDADPACVVTGDAASLARAITNLRDNAIRHGTQHRINIERVDDSTIALHVDDNGPGIPAEQRERIFERLVRLDSARARDDGGTGLGLAIVAAIARAHHGTIAVTDSPLGGARFTLTLPAAGIRPLTPHADPRSMDDTALPTTLPSASAAGQLSG